MDPLRARGRLSTGWESCGGVKAGRGEFGRLRPERAALAASEGGHLTTLGMG